MIVKNLSYENRLSYTGLTTLSERRIRGDLIEVFKILKGFSKVNYNTWFKFSVNSRTRGHRYKLVKSRSKLDICINFSVRGLLMCGTVCLVRLLKQSL